jgi:hypothetical protein
MNSKRVSPNLMASIKCKTLQWGISTPCLKPELFGLIYLILEFILEVFTLETEQRIMSGGFHLHIGILVILENPIVVG